jgi:hypothetical protein
MGSLLSLSKSGTLLALHISELMLVVLGILLAFGIAGEYGKALPVKLMPEWYEAKRSRSRGTLFMWMVIVGVVGEFFCDAGILVFSSHLETIAEGEYSGLNTEAGKARRAAGDAEKSAADATERAANAEERARKIERENLLLHAQIDPRRLSGVQKSKMLPILEHGQRYTVVVASNPFIPEAGDFDHDLFFFLKDDVHWNALSAPWSHTDVGIFVGSISGAPADGISRLGNALGAAGISHTEIRCSATIRSLDREK